MQCKVHVIFFIACLWCVFVQAQTIIRVAPNGKGDGSSWGQASSIEDAITNASRNDKIWVRQGTYKIKSTLQINETLEIYGGYSGTGNQRNPAVYPSILSGDKKNSIIKTDYFTSDMVFDGLTFEDGFARTGTHVNDVTGGGALYLSGNGTRINNCIFRNNTSANRIGSGAIYLWSTDNIVIENSVFENNRVIRNDNNEGGNIGGGAMHIRFGKNNQIKHCKFINNSSYYPGGAIYAWGENATVIDCYFENNHSDDIGGAIYVNFDDLYVSNTVFRSNNSKLRGGAIYNNFGTVKVVNTLFDKNTASDVGGAIYNSEGIDIANTTFVDNNNTAVVFHSFSSDEEYTHIYNSILYNNKAAGKFAPDIAPAYSNSDFSGLDVRRSILQKYSGGTNNLVGVDPLFVNSSNGNYRIRRNSPAANAGNTALFNRVSVTPAGSSNDLYENERLIGNKIDMGVHELQLPGCTTITIPANGAVDVAVNTDISWEAVPKTTGYTISIGTTSGGTDVIDGQQVTGTTFELPVHLEVNTTYFVSVIPYNSAGEAIGCSEIRFKTEKTSSVVNCTSITNPVNGAENVPLDTNITWEEVANADEYYISIGTTSGGTDVVNKESVTGTTYTPEVDLEENTTYFVTVTPYNNEGSAEDCTEISFATETLRPIPGCATIVTPEDDQEDVPLNTDIIWESVSEADGYYISIGTTSGGTDVVNKESVTGTTYIPEIDLEENTTYFVTVTPYNNEGSAEDCTEISFTTETLTPPDCAVITTPVDGTTYPAYEGMGWEEVEGAESYRIYMGTTPGGTDVVNGLEPWEDFEDPESGTYYLKVIPYNEAGEAMGCEEISFSIVEPTPLPPGCTTMTSPADGDTDVPLDTEITWDAVGSASGYHISIRTDAGDIVINEEPVTGTSYNPATDFKENTTYHVSVVPFNDNGEATGCGEISFTTETLPKPPGCTAMSDPVDGAVNVPVDTNIKWHAVPEADGYYLTVGTSPGGTDLVDNKDVGSFTVDLFIGDWPANTTIYVTVTPYNSAGSATGCQEESFTTGALAPKCTTLSNPIDGATDVSVSANMEWNAVTEAGGYYLSVGTAPGGTDIVNNEDVGNTTVYDLHNDLPGGTRVYVSVVPYNTEGEAENCQEESFTTKTLPTPPGCTTIITPTDGAPDVATDTDISWNTIADADGYHISIGTTAGGTDIIDNQQVSGNTYNLTSELEENTIYHVRVVPYNGEGSASGCAGISFTTETLPTVPDCITIISPTDGAADIAVDTDITWDVVTGAEGYYISIGTAPGGTDMVNGQQVTGTTFNPVADFDVSTTYYVTIVPYNTQGNATGCTGTSFTTEALSTPPDCTTITSPDNGTDNVALDAGITWNAVAEAAGYYVSIGTVSGGTDVLNNHQVTGTTFDPATDFDENTTYYITVVPYNAQGSATGCTETSFTTEILATAPDCTVITSPADGAFDVATDTDISWNTIADADGYYISMGTTAGGADIIDHQQVSGNTYNLTSELDENITYYMTITPYNTQGSAFGCPGIRFTTKTDFDIDKTKYGFSPNGDGINDFWEIEGIENYPDNTVSVYNRWGDMVFRMEDYDNHSNVFTGVANKLTGLGGGRLPSGTYFFDMLLRDGNDLKKVKGFLVLRR
ncbi:T9SS type B sorting domain-containing protein [Sinomicrobium sp. M5D2P17]